jgi:membrane associated rhomboid family serine protease
MEQFISETPVATIIFLFTIVTSLYAFSNPEIYGKFMLHPYSVSRGQRVYTVITSGMIHKDWGHLLMNMMSYYFFAFQLESMIGHFAFAVLYIASLALSDLSTIIKHKEDHWYNSLGASGAVSAVIFSYILFYPFTKMIIFPLPIPIPAVLFGGLYLAYSAYASKQGHGNINHDAHFLGALSGIMITVIFYPQIVPHFINELSGIFQ